VQGRERGKKGEITKTSLSLSPSFLISPASPLFDLLFMFFSLLSLLIIITLFNIISLSRSLSLSFSLSNFLLPHRSSNLFFTILFSSLSSFLSLQPLFLYFRLSGWNPPTKKRQDAGDIIYIEMQVFEEEGEKEVFVFFSLFLRFNFRSRTILSSKSFILPFLFVLHTLPLSSPFFLCLSLSLPPSLLTLHLQIFKFPAIFFERSRQNPKRKKERREKVCSSHRAIRRLFH